MLKLSIMEKNVNAMVDGMATEYNAKCAIQVVVNVQVPMLMNVNNVMTFH